MKINRKEREQMKKAMNMVMVGLFVMAISGCCCMKDKKCCGAKGECADKPAAEKAEM